jgi:hypothetical protein
MATNMVILSATDGKIITTIPINVGTDGALFNPDTMEAFSSHGDGTLVLSKENSPASFVVKQVVQTMASARTSTLDIKTNRVITMASETTPPPAPAPGTPAPKAEVVAGGRSSRDRSRSLWSVSSYRSLTLHPTQPFGGSRGVIHATRR